MSHKSIDYDKVATIYDEVRMGDPEMVHQLLQGIDLRLIDRVLDIGCGTGNNTLLFTRISKLNVIGLDLSLGMLTEARSKTREMSFIHAPADRIPILTDSFEFIFMTEVIHHLPDVRATLEEIFRILKQEGKMCIVTQSHEQIADRMTSRFFPDTIAIDQARYPSIPFLECELNEVGFSQVHTDYYTFAPVQLGAKYLHTVEKRGFSMLHKITDEAYAKGLANLRTSMKDGKPLDYSAGYSFVWASKA